MNTFGEIYRLTSFGESHGKAIGGIIDGIPAGVNIDISKIQAELDRRKPGQSDIVTARKEDDKLEILSGIFNDITLGTPIGFIIRNKDHHSSDYDEISNVFRPSHADYTYHEKYGLHDYRGGGRSSARETISRVVAGAFAKQILSLNGISIYAYTSQVGDIRLAKNYNDLDLSLIDKCPVRCPDAETANKMLDLIRTVKSEGNTIGGIITGIIRNCPVGLGDPVFGKLHARLADAMMSINAAKGFDYGMGFEGINQLGSEVLDQFIPGSNSKLNVKSNFSGGIQGGITNGADIYFRVAFKPVATLLKDIETVDKNGKPTILHARGRHDPCVLPRAVPIVEAMAAMVILDALLLSKTCRI